MYMCMFCVLTFLLVHFVVRLVTPFCFVLYSTSSFLFLLHVNISILYITIV